MIKRKTLKIYVDEENSEIESCIVEFLALFNQIDKYLDRVLHLDTFLPFNEKIKRIITGNYYISRFVKLHQFQLKYFGEIRNQVTHGIKIDGHTYIQPTPYAISCLKEYVKNIKKPPRCIDIFGKDVFSAKYDDKLKSIIQTMEAKNYSHVPVYSHDGYFMGILNESRILGRIAKGESKDMDTAKVGDIKLITDNSYISFVSKKFNVYEADKLFTDKKEKGEKNGIILITENGKRDEPLLGIVSAGDTALIDSYVVH